MKKSTTGIWVHICQYVQYNYVCIQDFFLSIKIEILSQLTFTDTLTYKISTI